MGEEVLPFVVPWTGCLIFSLAFLEIWCHSFSWSDLKVQRGKIHLDPFFLPMHNLSYFIFFFFSPKLFSYMADPPAWRFWLPLSGTFWNATTRPVHCSSMGHQHRLYNSIMMILDALLSVSFLIMPIKEFALSTAMATSLSCLITATPNPISWSGNLRFPVWILPLIWTPQMASGKSLSLSLRPQAAIWG